MEMNTVSFFEIQAADPMKAVAFYETVFGWTFVKEELMPIEYYRIKNAGMNGGLLKRPAKTPPMEYGTNAFVCSVEVEDFDATAKKIMDNGGTVALPKFAVPGKCWQGYFIDIDNTTFGIFEVDESAK
jgi:uncharacterized protein